MTPRVVRGVGNEFSVSGLAPGEYLVFAFDSIDGMEYGNPDAFAPYASQAAHITLTGNQRGQVSLDLIPGREGRLIPVLARIACALLLLTGLSAQQSTQPRSATSAAAAGVDCSAIRNQPHRQRPFRRAIASPARW